MSKSFKQKNNRAFTLIETLVAISVFTGAILGIMGVLSNNLADINYAKRKVIATYLAQEGVEYFRNMRDTFVLNQDATSSGWNDFLVKIADCEKTQGSSGCYFRDEMDYTDNNSPITGPLFGIVPCLNGVCESLKYNTTVGSYGYTGLTDSGFTRTINTAIVNDHEIQIYSTVSWSHAGRSSSVSFSENLFNWQSGI
ncbi:MAG: prepilin-type N-terminal cleavage/methylation domain-containing protein [bacterium]|nr:prepilin-type N-terminal cleavage/methylation domain-containing protein [bacterium]